MTREPSGLARHVTESPRHQIAAQDPQLGDRTSDEEREDIVEMSAVAEALLFTAPEPVPFADLRRTLAVRQPTLDRVLDHLGRTLSDMKRGLRLQRHDGAARLVTAPETAIYIEKLRGQQATLRISDAALETLALIAYLQPATRPQIEAVRGVDCSGVVGTLVARGLVEDVGRLETVGHPVLYGTTLAFLQHFGLENVGQLPSIGALIDKPQFENPPGDSPPDAQFS